MSDQTLNNIMCIALTDGKFRDALLANPGNVLGDFDLDAEEQNLFKSIRADSVTDLARKLHAWMLQRPSGGNGHYRSYRSKQAVHRLFLEPVE